MEQVSNDDFDFLLLRMQKKFPLKTGKEKKEEGEQWQDFGMDFSIRIPEGFKRAEEEKVSAIFQSEKRPAVILTAREGKEGFTFQFLSREMEGESLSHCKERIKQIIGQLDERWVFYSQGELSGTVWFDYKSFAEKERVYNLVFLFQTGSRKVLGTFFCLFEEYDRWKPRVLKLLETIRTKEEVHERL